MSSKYVFFSGKGGVGKTSMACTTGVHYADLGMKTLIVTTDPAANLSDVFGQIIGHEITKIEGLSNLYCMEIDSVQAANEYKERSLAPIRELFDDEFVRIAYEQLSGPCTEEMASFDKFVDYMDQDEYDVIVFDTAPTGHTIRLLELPVDWSNHIEDASKGSGQTCMGPVSLIQDSKDKYDRAIKKLRDKSVTEFIFVMQPDEVSFLETERSINDVSEIGISTTGVIVNAVLPENVSKAPFFSKRRSTQIKYIECAIEKFSNVDIKIIELFDKEMKGLSMFRKCREILYNTKYADETLVSEVSNLEKLLMPHNNTTRKIFFSGKGGVGKTSMACATAVYTAGKGLRTLLVTTDPASHIGMVLDKEVLDEVALIDGVPNLYAVKLDPKTAAHEYKETVLNDAKLKFNEQTVRTLKEELESPCTEEMAAFQKFIEYMQDTTFDVIVFDTAPTGHTLRLLNLPMEWSRQIELKAGESVEINKDDLSQKRKFNDVIKTLQNKDETTFCFVMYPEKTPIAEAHRASMELNDMGITTQMVVSNYNIPIEVTTDNFFKNRKKMQLKYSFEIEEKFSAASILEAPLYSESIKGIGMLQKLAADMFLV